MISFVNIAEQIDNDSIIRKDTNNCAVFAISNAFEISYDESFSFCSHLYSRKIRNGVRTFLFNFRNDMIYNNNICYYGKTLKIIDNEHISGGKSRKMSTLTFLRKYPKGTYILVVNDHTFTIKDSIIYGTTDDVSKLRRRILRCWKVEQHEGKSTIKREEITSDRYFGLVEGNYLYLGRLITKENNMWKSSMIVIKDIVVTYMHVDMLSANTLTKLESKIRQEMLLK